MESGKGFCLGFVPGRRIAPGGPWGSYLMRPNVTRWCCRIPPKRSAAVLCLRPAAQPWAKNIFAQGTGQGSERNQHQTRIKFTINPPSLPFSFFLASARSGVPTRHTLRTARGTSHRSGAPSRRKFLGYDERMPSVAYPLPPRNRFGLASPSRQRLEKRPGPR